MSTVLLGFHDLGVMPVAHIIWKRSLTQHRTWSGSIFRTSFVTASGPGALPVLRVESVSLNSVSSAMLSFRKVRTVAALSSVKASTPSCHG